MCCDSWGRKESDPTELLSGTEGENSFVQTPRESVPHMEAAAWANFRDP